MREERSLSRQHLSTFSFINTHTPIYHTRVQSSYFYPSCYDDVSDETTQWYFSRVSSLPQKLLYWSRRLTNNTCYVHVITERYDMWVTNIADTESIQGVKEGGDPQFDILRYSNMLLYNTYLAVWDGNFMILSVIMRIQGKMVRH